MTYTISVEVTVREVGAREDSKADLGGVVIRVRSGLCAADRTFDIGSTHCPLVPVLCEWLEVDGFDLYIDQ